MTQDEIIRMAREVFVDIDIEGLTEPQALERFAALVAAHEKKFWMEQIEVECNEAVLAEREACAKACEEGAGAYVNSDYTKGLVHGARLCAAAIRARGEK